MDLTSQFRIVSTSDTAPNLATTLSGCGTSSQGGGSAAPRRMLSSLSYSSPCDAFGTNLGGPFVEVRSVVRISPDREVNQTVESRVLRSIRTTKRSFEFRALTAKR